MSNLNDPAITSVDIMPIYGSGGGAYFKITVRAGGRDVYLTAIEGEEEKNFINGKILSRNQCFVDPFFSNKFEANFDYKVKENTNSE